MSETSKTYRRAGGTLKCLLVGLMAFVAAAASQAADWTDANNATYTALKSINGGGSGTTAGGFIITDITPAGTEIVKFKIKTPAAVSVNGCVYCARSFTYKSKKWNLDATQFTGFRLATKFRIDRRGTQTSLDDVTCTPTTEYSVSANYSTGAVTINNVGQSQNLGTGSYTPGGTLAIFASYSNIVAPASPTASSSWGNYLPDDLYYLQLWNADGVTLEHDFKPARRDSDRVIGLYDTVERKFWPATSGSFTGVELSSVATATWTGAANNGVFSDAGNWMCYDGVGNTLANVIPLSTTDITLGADVPDAGWTAFDASYAGTIDLNGHRLVICGGSNLAFSVTDSSSGTPGELRFTIPENVTFEKTSAFGISGNLSLVKDGPGTFLWSHDAESALSATIPVLVTNGVFKIGATTGNLFGASGTVTVKALGQFDINTAQQYGPVRARTFYIEGDGPDGSGAIVNSAECTQWGYQLNKIVLTGDATIGGRGFIDIRQSGNGIDCGGHELTVKNTGRLLVEEGTHLTNATDIVVSGGSLQACNSCVLGAERIVLQNDGTFVNYMTSGTQQFYVPFVVHEGTNTIKSSKNWYRINSSVTVESGCTLNLPTEGPWYDGAITNETGAAMNIGGDFFAVGGIFRNDGTVVHTAQKFYFGSRDDVTHPCRVENNGTIRTTGGDFQLKAESSMTGTGTLELAGGSPKVLGNLSGFTGTVVVSNGVAITFTGMNCGGTVAVLEGSKLTVDATSLTSVSNLSLEAGSTLDIANYVGTTPVVATSVTLPEGSVNLTLNGGAFSRGIYAICAAPGLTEADGGKFTFTTTDNQTATWNVADGTLFLTVGDNISGNYWTGRGGDGKMSTAANWLNGVPAAGEDIDLSLLSSATTIIADTDRAFGTATMGGGVVTFTGALTVKGFSDREKVVVGADSTVTIDDNVTPVDQNRLCNTIQAGGTLHITGSVNITSSTIFYVLRSYAPGGTIIVDDGIAVSGNGIVWWSSKVLVLGEKGISFTDNAPFLFIVDDNEVYALGERTVLGTEGRGKFRSNHDDVYLCTTQYGSDRPATITFDGYFNGVSQKDSGKANCSCWGHWRVTGCGKVVCTSAAKSNRGLRVNDGATLALNPNTNTFGQDDQTFYVYNEDSGTAGGTLEVAGSGKVTLTGNLSLTDGAALGFNFTDRNVPPQLALSSGKTLTANGAVKVKIPADCVRPKGGEHVLTTCGGFTAENVTLVAGAPDWVRGLSVNADGNLVLDVKPKGTMIIVR